MSNFPRIPASKRSMASRSLVHGVGVNDSDYMTHPLIGGNRVKCPIYDRWKSMLKRCYSSAFHKKYPTYIGCETCSEWLTFSNFRKWMVAQDWEGKELDKDLLVQGNKIYSPATCLFVSQKVNKLFVSCNASRGSLMLGVHFSKSMGLFTSACRLNGKIVNLGGFNTEMEAHNAYCDFKYRVIKGAAELEIEPLKSSLLRYKIPKY